MEKETDADTSMKSKLRIVEKKTTNADLKKTNFQVNNEHALQNFLQANKFTCACRQINSHVHIHGFGYQN